MKKMKWQNYLLATVSVYVVIFLSLSFLPQEKVDAPIQVPSTPAEIEGREDLQSRDEYERQMLVNPKTGNIPYNIKKDELSFAKELYREQLLNEIPLSNAGSEATEDLAWFPIGPENYGGRTRALAVDIRDEDVLLAGGVSGGMWRSTNFGANWRKTTTNDQIQSVTAIVQDTRAGREDTWYYGTGELVGNSTRAPGAPFRGDGIYKSTDGGITWSVLSSTNADEPGLFVSPFQYVWDMEIDPSSTDDVVLAAVFGGIVRSTDGGQSWTTVLGRDLLNEPAGADLNEIAVPFYTDIHRTIDNIYYATISSATNDPDNTAPSGGVYRSEDGGITWVNILSYSNEVVRRTEVGSSQSNPDVAYFISDGPFGNRLYRYNHATSFLTNISSNLPDGENSNLEEFNSQGSYNLLVAIHPNDENVVYAGGTNLYRSTDGFTTEANVEWVGGYNPESPNEPYANHHPDQHELIFLPSYGNRMISANDGGIFLTNNNLAEEIAYESMNNGFITTQYYTAAISQFPEENVVFGGTQDNGSIVTVNQPVFDNNSLRVLGGDGGWTATTPFGFYYYLSFQNSRIFRLTLNENSQITSFARVDPTGGGTKPSQPYLFINPFVLDPYNANKMYLAGGDVIWRNRNLSQLSSGSQLTTSNNWDELTRTSIDEGQITALQISTENRDWLYYGTSTGRIFKVGNANTIDYVVTEITRDNLPELAYVRSIAVDPRDNNTAMVAFSNYQVPSIFLTTDGGDSFVGVSGNLEENLDGTGNGPSVRWVTIVPQTDGTNFYLAGTSTGLYSTEVLDGSNTTWSLESPDIIGNTVVNMIDYRRFDGKIAIATHGRGMFTAEVPNVDPFDNVLENKEFEIVSVAPNPFSDFVSVRLNVPESRFSLIRIYDTNGNLVRRISNSAAFQGENEFFWDGTDAAGARMPDGIYIFRITYGGTSLAKRVILQRN